MAVIYYTPEMGEKRPAVCDGDLRHSSIPGKFILKTHLDLSGRGIDLTETLRDGRKKYYLTARAKEILDERYTFAYEILLD